MELVRINQLALILSLCELLHFLFGDEQALEIIQRPYVYILLGCFDPYARGQLELIECLEPEAASLWRENEVLVSEFGALDQGLVGRAQDFDDSGQLVVLRIAGEDGNAQEKFGTNATERPHVDGCVVGQSQQHFGTTVVPGLDVLEDGKAFKACAAEVDHFNVQVILAITRIS